MIWISKQSIRCEHQLQWEEGAHGLGCVRAACAFVVHLLVHFIALDDLVFVLFSASYKS